MLDDAFKASLSATLQNTTLWLAIDGDALVQEQRSSLQPSTVVIRLPSIGFSAFHPDICFVSTDAIHPRSDPPFHSAIAAWAYRHELSLAQTCALYQPQHYAALGYFSAWDASVAYLEKQFQLSDLAVYFEPFFLAIKRQGCFMHTFNHPKPFVITLLCQTLCRHLGITPEGSAILNEEDSTLSALDWPVYPEIALMLGLPSAALGWRHNQRWIPDLAAFVDEQFALYARWQIAPKQLQPMHRDGALLDRVLGASAGACV